MRMMLRKQTRSSQSMRIIHLSLTFCEAAKPMVIAFLAVSGVFASATFAV